ncbi:MAG: hypothetical protein PHD32_04835, partial [Eubacteriales bacterium]|nr:hypothetical protein [Eubacteriales bacterium]
CLHPFVKNFFHGFFSRRRLPRGDSFVILPLLPLFVKLFSELFLRFSEAFLTLAAGFVRPARKAYLE